MSADPIALRVARRHRAEVLLRNVPTTRVEYDRGRISSAMLVKMLEPKIGKLLSLKFRPTLFGPRNVLVWEALTRDAEVVSGKLVLHVGVTENEIVSWSWVVVDP